jgi:hypothetical protein
MKKMRFLALAVLLVALAANGMVRHPGQTHLLCDDVPGQGTLCNGTVDTGCNTFCQSDPQCDGFTGVHGRCSDSGDCSCRGTPLP